MLDALDSERVPLKRTLAGFPATPLDEGVSPWRQGRCHWLAPRPRGIKPGSENGALTVLTRLRRCRPRSGKGRISARRSVTLWRTSKCQARGLGRSAEGDGLSPRPGNLESGPGEGARLLGMQRGLARSRVADSGLRNGGAASARIQLWGRPGAGRNRLAQGRRLLSGTVVPLWCAGMFVGKQVRALPTSQPKFPF